MQMENNTLEIEIERPDEKNGVETSMENKLGSLLSVSDNKCCIYKVPEFILKGNEKFYRPLEMSLGPVYYKDAKLETMQEVKWIYLNSFLQHPNNAFPRLKPYIDFVRIKEKKIRDSYQQPSRLSSDEFVEMIVLDATFLVYHSMCLFNLAFDRPYIENKL
uniref:Uncharacterized protein n=1 Tax=Chenopodium quinoa TaxID=63459 RepID=A0A803MJS4_CHEQI